MSTQQVQDPIQVPLTMRETVKAHACKYVRPMQSIPALAGFVRAYLAGDHGPEIPYAHATSPSLTRQQLVRICDLCGGSAMADRVMRALANCNAAELSAEYAGWFLAAAGGESDPRFARLEVLAGELLAMMVAECLERTTSGTLARDLAREIGRQGGGR